MRYKLIIHILQCGKDGLGRSAWALFLSHHWHRKIRLSLEFECGTISTNCPILDRRGRGVQSSYLRCTGGACARPPGHDIEIETGSRDELQSVEQEYPALKDQRMLAVPGETGSPRGSAGRWTLVPQANRRYVYRCTAETLTKPNNPNPSPR